MIRVKGKDYPFVNKYLDRDIAFKKKKVKIGILSEGIWVFDNYKKYAIDSFNERIQGLQADNQFQVKKINPGNEYNNIHNLHKTIYDKTLSYYFKQESQNINHISNIMRKLIENGNRITTNEYKKALNQQAILRAKFEKEISSYDIILTLSTAGEAPPFGKTETPDTCLIWTFLGMPALNLPIFKGPNTLPFGLQMISSRYNDHKLLEIANKIL